MKHGEMDGKMQEIAGFFCHFSNQLSSRFIFSWMNPRLSWQSALLATNGFLPLMVSLYTQFNGGSSGYIVYSIWFGYIHCSC